MNHTDKALLPGEELVNQGMDDLKKGLTTEMSLLVLIAAPRLRSLGIDVPQLSAAVPYEHQLYSRLEQRLGSAAHSYYNSLIRRIVSYARARERERTRANQVRTEGNQEK